MPQPESKSMRLFLVSLFAVSSAGVVAVEFSDDVQRGVYFSSFKEESPLAAPDALAKRLNFAARKNLETYELGKEQYDIYVPKNYSASVPHALLVWINAGDCGLTPNEWYPTFDKHHVICIGAAKTGNERPALT